MKGNLRLALLVVVAVATGALGYFVYERQNRAGLDISIGGSNFSIRER